ncbi:uncharacterized protein CLAFUR5_13764 [Fulvia fulva]|uniref:Rhodopsin domain-containing protein n=1 Tax=Passalora fulva TaxID=5499 RepID=A0A9Q8UWB1_PASFU|nr:uncharacterized protein CLAFUR5_13764 [Fulvia fulva]UJO24818.1 hypothetical protein CLAFUR5_13764 [Fulvia fulva]WPV37151.1 hypothetical protein CLAFUW7_13930 [Fulvia fulva]
MDLLRRNPDIHYADPQKELNVGIWTLYAGATGFLAARVGSKVTRRHGLWWDDYILLFAWCILTITDTIIAIEYATGYVSPEWDDRMHILINITSCGNLLGQSLTKSAFAVTLLKLTRGFSHWKICHGVLWFCICVVEWGRICDSPSYQVWYRLDFCLSKHSRNRFKEGGNYYNVVMDFVFAAFPWVVTYGLDMKRKEKIALCLTMSLGMVVAIESAIRTEWKFDGNKKDEWYFWRNAMSNIWYSSEVTGTVIVQCVPVLRPLVQDLHTSLRSKSLGSTIDEVALDNFEPHWYHAK